MQTIDRQCEKFMGGPTVPYKERVHVTLDAGGRIFLNQKAHKMMGKPLGVYLYYNRQKDMIILEKTDALTAPNAFVFKDGGYSSRIIWAGPFCKHFNIRVQGTVKFLDPATDAWAIFTLNCLKRSTCRWVRAGGGRKMTTLDPESRRTAVHQCLR